MKPREHIKAMADDMGISMYQRFSEVEAAAFLQMDISSLATARQQKKVAYFQVQGGEVEYFGHQILSYLLRTVQGNTTLSDSDKPDRIIRSHEVTKMTGLSRTTIWRKELENDFPQRVSLGGTSVGWRLSEITKWIKSRS